MENVMKEDFVTAVNFYAPSSISKQYKPFPGEEPEVLYLLKATATLKPHICPHSNGLDIPLQHNELFQPLELRRIYLKSNSYDQKITAPYS